MYIYIYLQLTRDFDFLNSSYYRRVRSVCARTPTAHRCVMDID